MLEHYHLRALLHGGHRSLRRRLLRDLAMVILFFFGAILAIIFLQGSEIRREAAGSYIRETASQASVEFKRFFEPLSGALFMIQQWGREGLLDLADVPSLNAKFMPMLKQFQQAAAIVIARSDGSEYLLSRDQGKWLTLSLDARRYAGQALWRRWDGPRQLSDEWRETAPYDPRSRPWYQGALQTARDDVIFWTKPYIFSTRKAPGISGSLRWNRKDGGEQTFVVALDVLLRDVFDHITQLQPTTNGKTFLFNEEGDVYRMPDDSGLQEGLAVDLPLLTPLGRIGDAVISSSITGWLQTGKSSPDPLELRHDGETWWAGFHPLDPGDPKLWVGVAVPEKDFLGDVRRRRYSTMAMIAASLAGAVVVAALVIRKHSARLKTAPAATLSMTDPGGSILALIRAGEGSSLEFKATMRMNLKAGKPGKEMELAWLKTVVAFMNTDGGIILIGVDDKGRITGTEADAFENDDKCRLHFKNLVNQHVGAEFSQFVTFEIVAVEGRKVAFIACQRSRQPVFLISGDEEAFYIRSGPASVKLPTSKVLKYLEHRKQ